MEFDQNGKKISDLGGDKIDFYHQADGSTKVVDRKTKATNIINASKDGKSLFRGYTHRPKDISWSRIYWEWDIGALGPTNSLIADFDDSNIGVFASLNNAFSSYASLARQDALRSTFPKGSVNMDYSNANPFVAKGMWEQMMGRVTICWYKLGDKILFIIFDSKSMKSLAYRMMPSWERTTFKIPYGNTYQTYMWTESIVEVEDKVDVLNRYWQEHIHTVDDVNREVNRWQNWNGISWW